MTTLVLLARILLAAIFLVSAVAKLRDRPGSRKAVIGFGVPAPLVAPVATGLPFVELASAGLLVSADPAATVGALVALLILASFTIAIVVNLLRGNRVDCHCFGQIGAASIGWPTVARNAALMMLAGLSLVGAGTLGSVPAVLADYEAAELAVGTVALLLAAAVGVLSLALRTLMGRYGSVLLRLEALEVVTGTAPPKPAPHFALPDVDGRLLDLDDVLAHGRPTLVAFISPSCLKCEALLPDFESWQQDPDAPVSVIVVSSGTPQENREKLGGRSVRVLLQDGDVATAWDMRGTPAAYLLGADGLFAASTAYGVEAVRALYTRTVRTVTGRDRRDLHQIVPRPVAPGDPVPEVEVSGEDGAILPLADVVGEDTVVLLFWRSSCGFCARIVEQVAALEATTRIILVTGTEVAELRGSGLLSPVAREKESALTRGLQVPGTPAAVRIRAGMVDSVVAVGGPPVLELLGASSVAETVASG